MLSCFRHVQCFVTPRTVAYQATLSMGFSRQEQWSGLPCPPPGDLPNPWIQHASPISPALAGGFFTAGATWEALIESYTATFHGGGGLVAKSCLTLGIPWTGNLPGFCVHGILQARILGWVAISLSTFHSTLKETNSCWLQEESQVPRC